MTIETLSARIKELQRKSRKGRNKSGEPLAPFPMVSPDDFGGYEKTNNPREKSCQPIGSRETHSEY
jgi:hypothetical protein